MSGLNRTNSSRIVIMIRKPKISLIVKYGWNGILSVSEFMPDGLLEPVSCRKIRWTIARAAITNGKIKWKAKNRVRVALSTENPPQIHSTRVVPM